ncbi:hypothetical protein [Jiangella alba]|uniref:Carbohydrate binding domain-containing protein n=1 Tax=Jiangella alba TaxID=561176 RepID=A0A1H5PC99_9ACTN|nr:hypothetical protein [Jiangella alba]SEF11542.1 hypothetical protein SAMN04488561_4089 [Jiangella alba]
MRLSRRLSAPAALAAASAVIGAALTLALEPAEPAELAGPGSAAPPGPFGAASAVLTSDAAAEPVEVEVPNAGFEEVDGDGWATGWRLDPARAQTATVVEGDAHAGERSLEVVDPPGSGIAIWSSPVESVRDGEYEASAWIRTVSGVPAWLYLEFYDANGRRVSETHVTPEASATWQRVTVAGTAPAAATTLKLLVYGSNSSAGTSYVDDVALRLLNPPPPYDPVIGQRTQLFHDLDRVDTLTHVGRVVHEGELTDQPILSPDRPWEANNVYLYGSVLFDEDEQLYKMWYHSYNWDLGEYLNLYATSRNGRTWDKPELGVYEFDGSTANNIVIGDNIHSPSVLKDPFEDDPARRYKMMAMDYEQGYVVYFSPDGVRWTACGCNPVSTGADVANIFQDPETGEFGVMWKQPDLRPVPNIRYAFLSTSADFETWSEPELVLAADQRDQLMATADGHTNAQIYGFPVTAYQGGWVGFPWIYKPGGGTPGMAGSGPVDVQVAFSDDLRTWTRDDRRSVIPRGVPGSWDAGMIYTASSLVQTGRDLRLYYSGWDGFHDGSPNRGAAIGMATWRVDGFASLANGGDQPGVVTTRPLVFDGRALSVNAALAPGGTLRVEILDADGEPIPGFTLEESRKVMGDRTDHRIRWSGAHDLSALAGTPVRLRFHLDDGDLYSYRFHG